MTQSLQESKLRHDQLFKQHQTFRQQQQHQHFQQQQKLSQQNYDLYLSLYHQQQSHIQLYLQHQREQKLNSTRPLHNKLNSQNQQNNMLTSKTLEQQSNQKIYHENSTSQNLSRPKSAQQNKSSHNTTVYKSHFYNLLRDSTKDKNLSTHTFLHRTFKPQTNYDFDSYFKSEKEINREIKENNTNEKKPLKVDLVNGGFNSTPYSNADGNYMRKNNDGIYMRKNAGGDYKREIDWLLNTDVYDDDPSNDYHSNTKRKFMIASKVYAPFLISLLLTLPAIFFLQRSNIIQRFLHAGSKKILISLFFLFFYLFFIEILDNAEIFKISSYKDFFVSFSLATINIMAAVLATILDDVNDKLEPETRHLSSKFLGHTNRGFHGDDGECSFDEDDDDDNDDDDVDDDDDADNGYNNNDDRKNETQEKDEDDEKDDEDDENDEDDEDDENDDNDEDDEIAKVNKDEQHAIEYEKIAEGDIVRSYDRYVEEKKKNKNNKNNKTHDDNDPGLESKYKIDTVKPENFENKYDKKGYKKNQIKLNKEKKKNNKSYITNKEIFNEEESVNDDGDEDDDCDEGDDDDFKDNITSNKYNKKKTYDEINNIKNNNNKNNNNIKNTYNDKKKNNNEKMKNTKNKIDKNDYNDDNKKAQCFGRNTCIDHNGNDDGEKKKEERKKVKKEKENEEEEKEKEEEQEEEKKKEEDGCNKSNFENNYRSSEKRVKKMIDGKCWDQEGKCEKVLQQTENITKHHNSTRYNFTLYNNTQHRNTQHCSLQHYTQNSITQHKNTQNDIKLTALKNYENNEARSKLNFLTIRRLKKQKTKNKKKNYQRLPVIIDKKFPFKKDHKYERSEESSNKIMMATLYFCLFSSFSVEADEADEEDGLSHLNSLLLPFITSFIDYLFLFLFIFLYFFSTYQLHKKIKKTFKKFKNFISKVFFFYKKRNKKEFQKIQKS